MDSSENEDVLEGIKVDGRHVALDLSFLCNAFLRNGSEIHLRVLRGLPDGANAVAAGIVDDTLVLVFDTDVPAEIWFQDIGKKVEISTKELN